MAVTHGTTSWPIEGGEKGWGVIDLATGKLWVPAAVNLHTGGTDYWTIYTALAVPGSTGPKLLGQLGHTAISAGDALIPIGVQQKASPADLASEGQIARLQMSGGRLFVSAVVTGTVTLGAAAVRIGKVTIRNAADNADIDPLAESTFTGRFPAAAAVAAGTAYPTTTIERVVPMLDNGATLDPEQGVVAATALASAARTATTAASLTNRNARGIMIWVNVTANPGGGETLTPQVQAIDPVTGSNPNLWVAPSTITGNALVSYIIYPGVGAAANNVTDTRSYPLPRLFNIRIAHSGAGSWTYSVGYCLLL